MSTKKQPSEEQVKQWQAEWVELVHAGICCASVARDPHQEQKDKLIAEMKEEKVKNSKI